MLAGTRNRTISAAHDRWSSMRLLTYCSGGRWSCSGPRSCRQAMVTLPTQDNLEDCELTSQPPMTDWPASLAVYERVPSSLPPFPSHPSSLRFFCLVTPLLSLRCRSLTIILARRVSLLACTLSGSQPLVSALSVLEAPFPECRNVNSDGISWLADFAFVEGVLWMIDGLPTSTTGASGATGSSGAAASVRPATRCWRPAGDPGSGTAERWTTASMTFPVAVPSTPSAQGPRAHCNLMWRTCATGGRRVWPSPPATPGSAVAPSGRASSACRTTLRT
mmetsp:Transcript_51811/g.162743  ORF Transcript_51811/g.162743 Transcript_51811/m.162743 type:complete len:277 (-) Transcript_51811:1196-2026(-)